MVLKSKKVRVKKSKRTILPVDFRDYLSIVSFTGFLGMFFKFTLNQPFLSANILPIFLVVSGIGLMVLGKVFTITKWLKDGLQENEILKLFSITFGVSSVVIGILKLISVELSRGVDAFAGFLALFPMALIVADYIARKT